MPLTKKKLPDEYGVRKEEKKPIVKKEPKVDPDVQNSEYRVKSYLDLITPSIIKFNSDYFIFGNTTRCVWAVRDYQTSTTEQAILRGLGEKDGITLHVYTRHVTPIEEKKIISEATKKNRMNVSNNDDMKKNIIAQSNLQDVESLIAKQHKEKEPLVHTAVFIEMIADDLTKLKELQTEVQTELTRSKINYDKLLLRQKDGFTAVNPVGYNAFRDQFERVLPASAAANLFPMNYSGKTDSEGFFIGRDKCGSNIILDMNKRADDKTNSNVLILGNSGQGKSYLLKLLLINIRLSGKSVIALDPETEYEELTINLGGCYLDLTSGKNIINVLEPKLWATAEDVEEKTNESLPKAFTFNSKLSQHISFLKDFFKCYKSNFEDRHLDTLEILIEDCYKQCNINNETDFDKLKPTEYPILSDLYKIIDDEFMKYEQGSKTLFTEDTLRELALGLRSICIGSDSKFFNGHTNITDSKFICFGVKGMLEANESVQSALLFNVLSYMSNELLTKGNTAASLDELYLFLKNPIAIEYIRNFSKRVRKRNSAVLLASQNLEDFDTDKIREYTKPLFAIPTFVFLFNAGNTNAKFYMESLQLEQSEYDLIRYPKRGSCLFKCGNERFHLQVQAPEYKAALFGNAGGK